MDRRRFMFAMGALGAAARRSPAAQAGEKPPLTYNEVRSKLAASKIFLVPYSHDDYSYLHTHLWDKERIPEIQKEALEIMRREKDFKWHIDTEFECFSLFVVRYPELWEELRKRVEEGRFGIAPGSVCNPDNVFMEPEALIRNL